ncbi:26s proteasome non-atpase regulatory subunit 9 [Anaeramoeba ignava]|uniref:26s proteasome non-atpase regulatory subunit 9 n=1 Tax=Anaeramoeba ignava TaxID=1746090 RepID=A0A9Q0LFA6_ANAIG|nr:26s proteasome non-atpase regulatory subunit 9 [Anaeramoeba ignava]
MQNEMLNLSKKKEEYEKEIEELTTFLEEKGCGVHGSLVDQDGFPRSDAYEIRIARNRLAILQTDHLNLMKEIEKKLFAFYQSEKKSEEKPIYNPFAIINAVADECPAKEAGLQKGDEILFIGSCNSMSEVSEEVARFVGQKLKFQFLRDGKEMVVFLIPRIWDGPGFLGCHIIPYK